MLTTLVNSPLPPTATMVRQSSSKRSRPHLSRLSFAVVLMGVAAGAVRAEVNLGESSSLQARDDGLLSTADEARSGSARAVRRAAGDAVEETEDRVTKLERRAAAPASIPISSSSPSTSSLSASFVSTYDSLVSSLSSHTSSAVSSAISSSLSPRLAGFPGTAISSSAEATSLQSYLDCTSSTGEWVYDATGAHLAKYGAGLTVHKQEGRYAGCEKRFYKGREVGEGVEEGEWDVRESLKWRWVPSPSCRDLAPTSLSSLPAVVDDAANPLDRSRLCHLLAHKSTLLLGDTTQYSLHDFILDWTTTEPLSCYGDLYCKEHALCGEILKKKKTEGERKRTQKWEDDERVYHRLPLPPALTSAKEKRAVNGSAAEQEQINVDNSLPHSHPHSSSHDDPHSHSHDLDKRQSSHSPSYGTLLRYRRTDGLRPATAYTHPTYKHPFNGIREVNQQWLADSRRSDIVILTKSPLPLPLRKHNATWDEWVYETLDGDSSVEEKAARLFEAAEDVTRNVWLPELLEALKAIRAPPSPADQLVVYRSGWREHADCGASALLSSSPLAASSPGDGPPPHPSQPDLASLLFRPSSSPTPKELQPPSIIFHNLQLLLQNRLAREVVLPAFGIPYLDLETPLSIWRSGMVGSSAAAPFVALTSGGQQQVLAAGPALGLRSPASGDCSRYCFPSPGLAVEEFFLGALARVFEAGWAGSDGREQEWVGDGFKNLRERAAEREKEEK